MEQNNASTLGSPSCSSEKLTEVKEEENNASTKSERQLMSSKSASPDVRAGENLELGDVNIGIFLKCEYENMEGSSTADPVSLHSTTDSDARITGFHMECNSLSDESEQDSLHDSLEEDAMQVYSDTGPPEKLVSKTEKKPSKGLKPLTCPTCNQDFKKLSQHRCKAGIKYPCDVCGNLFAHVSSLNAHKKLHTGFKYECKTCGKFLTTKNSYLSHQARHLQIKPYVCDFCEKSFVKKNYLVEHRRIHLGIRPYVCETCGKSFTRNTHLVMHMGSHISMFSCEICNKNFTRKGQLVEHHRVHTGEKPHKCDECGKCYTRKSHLFTHRNSHSKAPT